MQARVRRVREFEEVPAHRPHGYQVVAPLNGRLHLAAGPIALELTPPTLAVVAPDTEHTAAAATTTDLFDVLLRVADVSIEEAAAPVGYASTSHFYRAFKRHHGVTPQQLRSRTVPSS